MPPLLAATQANHISTRDFLTSQANGQLSLSRAKTVHKKEEGEEGCVRVCVCYCTAGGGVCVDEAVEACGCQHMSLVVDSSFSVR